MQPANARNAAGPLWWAAKIDTLYTYYYLTIRVGVMAVAGGRYWQVNRLPVSPKDEKQVLSNRFGSGRRQIR